MRNRFKSIIPRILLICALGLTGLSVEAQEEAKRILFVGNSFIYYHNLPQMVAAMAKTQGIELETRQSTVGGSNLEQHWKGDNGTKTRELLDSEKWDYVVFNNHSLSALLTPGSFDEYGKKFAELVKQKGAMPVFMITWGYLSNPLIQGKVTPAYEQLAKESGAMIVPAGPLLSEARKLRPDLKLYEDDKHPSANGTYLIGLTFFKFFTGRATAEIPHRLGTYDEDGELLYLCFLSEQDADFFQMLVDDSVFDLAK